MRASNEFFGSGARELRGQPRCDSDRSPDFPDWVKAGSLATMNALEQLRQHPELEWSFLAPSAQLEPEERTETIRLGTDRLLADAKGQSKISVQDFAVAMINELENPQHVRQGSQRATDLRLPS